VNLLTASTTVKIYEPESIDTRLLSRWLVVARLVLGGAFNLGMPSPSTERAASHDAVIRRMSARRVL
jgi:hypothetical protein